MLGWLKQKLDRWAIEAAAGALPAGKHDPGNVERAADLLGQEKLFPLPDGIPELRESGKDAFEFRSTATIGLPKTDLVHGRLFRIPARDWTSKPFVILVHGWNAELHYLHILPRVARALNRSGMNAALVELPLHLQRRPPRGACAIRDFISDDLVTMLLATRQALADFHGLIQWARAQGCPAVALWGFSLGGWLAGLYICESTLASHAVLTTPIIDLHRAVRELSFCHPVRAAMKGASLDLSRLNLAIRSPRIAPEHIYVMRGQYDLFVPPESYETLVQEWNLRGTRIAQQSHLSVLLSRRSTQGAIRWLTQQFGSVIPQETRPGAASLG